ncbi:MAG: hypothetical protein FWD24_00725 [Treponema sp.]|nr:hypothetical protein [Treponema sp.]
MSKKNTQSNAIYAPGELDRVRGKLGVTDANEAKRMANILGGDIGTERSAEDVAAKNKKSGSSAGDKPSKRIRRVDVTMDDDDIGKPKTKRSGPYPGDDPSVPARLSYSERVKIDQYAAQVVFEIKTSMQVLTSIFSFFKEPVDYVNPRFVNVRLNEYFNKIEKLVNAARSLFPKNNNKRNNQLKRASIFVYKILDTIRNWDIEMLSKHIADLQAHPRTIKVTDFSEVLRGIYKPIFILEELSLDNIKSAFKLVYKVLYIESPMDAKEKYQDVIRNIIASIVDIRRNVHFGLYPLLMKLISDRYIVYERFFIERRRRYMAFLNIKETDQFNPADLNPQQIENVDIESLQKNLNEDDENAENGETGEGQEEEIKEDPNDPKVIERKAREDAERAQQKAMEQSRNALGVLFPKAGWEKLESFPDLYPYFSSVYGMRHGYELIAPSDPMQQVSILLHILDDLFIGLRYVIFSTIVGPDGSQIRLYEELGAILNNWRGYIEDSFSRDFLPRLSEYCRILENSRDSRSAYAKKSMNELHWIKRLYFLPYYKFESLGPPPFPKKDIVPIYAEARKLRKYLTAVAMGIEQGMRAGGAATKAACNGINNPWENYNFQVPNPISKRMDMMLPPERKINATLIFFSLSAITLLDNLINNENSWAYAERPGPIFRSYNNEGVIPLFGVDEKIDADKLFKESIKKPPGA